MERWCALFVCVPLLQTAQFLCLWNGSLPIANSLTSFSGHDFYLRNCLSKLSGVLGLSITWFCQTAFLFFSICHQHHFLEILFSTWVCMQTSYPSRQNKSGIFHHFLFHRCDKVIHPLPFEELFSCSRKQQLAVMHTTSLINDLWNGGSSSQCRLGREANRPALL